jgi:hypothetical protein
MGRDPQPGTSLQKSKLCHSQKRSMQGSDSGAYRNFHLGFNHINVNVKNLLLSLNAVWLFYITLTDCHKNALFTYIVYMSEL